MLRTHARAQVLPLVESFLVTCALQDAVPEAPSETAPPPLLQHQPSLETAALLMDPAALRSPSPSVQLQQLLQQQQQQLPQQRQQLVGTSGMETEQQQGDGAGPSSTSALANTGSQHQQQQQQQQQQDEQFAAFNRWGAQLVCRGSGVRAFVRVQLGRGAVRLVSTRAHLCTRLLTCVRSMGAHSLHSRLTVVPPSSPWLPLCVHRFAERHKRLLNAYVHRTPSLLESSFASLLRAPKLLDFDNKRVRARGHSAQDPEVFW